MFGLTHYIKYIHNNPIRIDLAQKVEDWKWSSTRGYFTDKPGLGENEVSSRGIGGSDWCYHTQEEERHYLYDGDALIAVFSSSDDEQSYYVNGLGGAVAVYSMNETDKRYYIMKDQVGSNRMFVNDTGKVMEYTNYYPYGGILEDYTMYKDRMKFSGKEWDDFDGFEYNYFGARYYDPDIGMFNTIDKAAQLASGYNYCANNPISFIDPDGNMIHLDYEMIVKGICGVDYSDNPEAEDYDVENGNAPGPDHEPDDSNENLRNNTDPDGGRR